MKARIENQQIKTYSDLPQDFENILNFRLVADEILKSYEFYDVITPVYNIDTQKLGVIYFDSENEVFTYPVINKTMEQIKAEQIQKINTQAQRIESSIDQKLLKKLLVSQIEKMPKEEAIEFRTLYKPYRVGIVLAVNERFYYPANDKLYKVIQPHTTQLDWKPDQTPALYLEVFPIEVIPNWVQPTGAHDVYNIGDKVIYNTFTWKSNVNNNVWEPRVYGWTQL